MMLRFIFGFFCIAAGFWLLGFSHFIRFFFQFIWCIVGIFLIIKGLQLILGKYFPYQRD